VSSIQLTATLLAAGRDDGRVSGCWDGLTGCRTSHYNRHIPRHWWCNIKVKVNVVYSS